MGKGQRGRGLIQKTLENILVAGTEPQPSVSVKRNLFYHHKSIDMAINWAQVKKMTLAQLLDYPEFKLQFIHMYDCHKGQDYYIGGEAFYEQEVAFMLTLFRENEKLAASTTISIATAMISGVAYHGLSIEPVSKGFAYLIPTPQNIGSKQQAQWIDTCKYRISAYGELELRRRNGVITRVKNPIMVYDGDIFETALKTINGKSKMEIVQHIPKRKSEKITHAYIILSLPGGDEDIKVFSMEEIQGFRRLNRNETMRNSGMWTGGFDGQPMRGTIEAKVIKHAFSTYPRLNLGASGASLETEDIDKQEDAVNRQYDRDAQLANVMGGGGAPGLSTDDDDQYQDQQQEEQAEEDDDPTPPPTRTRKAAETPAPVDPLTAKRGGAPPFEF